MKRDKELYGRAARLLELAKRRERMGLTSRMERTTRERRIVRAHYRAQHAAGATDYPENLPARLDIAKP